MIVSKNDIPIYEAEVGTVPKVSFLKSLLFRFEDLINFRISH